MDDLDRARLVATTLDSLEITTRKYPDAAENAARVVELGGTIMHGLDATALESCKALKGMSFDSVVFNYPHLGSGETDQDRNGAPRCMRSSLMSQSGCTKSCFCASSARSRRSSRPLRSMRRDLASGNDATSRLRTMSSTSTEGKTRPARCSSRCAKPSLYVHSTTPC